MKIIEIPVRMNFSSEIIEDSKSTQLLKLDFYPIKICWSCLHFPQAACIFKRSIANVINQFM